MVDLLLVAAGAVVFFVGGVLVGAHNAPTVDKSIAALKAAEASAQATIDKITAHKAS